MSSARSSPGGAGGPSPSPSPDSAGDDHLSEDEIFHILSNDRRRYLLHYLMQVDDGSVTLREASRQVAAWENGVPLEEVDPQMRRRVYVAFQQTHVPKLTDSGVVEYSEAQSTIGIADRIDDLRVYLDIVNGKNIPWSEFYLGLGALLSALTALVWVGLPPFDLVPHLAWAAVVVGMFTATAAIHVYIDQQMELGADGPPPSIKRERAADD